MNPSNILIIRFSSAGDLVLLSPLIRCVRAAWPNANFDMLVRSDMKDLIGENPHLDNKYYYQKEKGMSELVHWVRELKHKKYDLVIDSHNRLKSRLISFLLHPARKTVQAKRSIQRLLLIALKLNRLKNRRLVMEEYFEPLRALGVRYDGKGTEIFVSENREDKMRILLTERGYPQKPFIGIAPGASFFKKAYPMDDFKVCALRLLNETGFGLILFGGKNDEKLFLPGYEDRVLDLQGKADMQEAASAARQCKLVLTNDSLMLHLAESQGTDVLALFGPTSRELGYFPHRPGSLVLETNQWCRPCSKHGQGKCYRQERYCFTEIGSDKIVDTIKRMTGKKTP